LSRPASVDILRANEYAGAVMGQPLHLSGGKGGKSHVSYSSPDTAIGVGLVVAFATRPVSAAIIDHVTTEVTPNPYEGSCPVSIKLEGSVTFGLSPGQKIKYVDRWEGGGRVLTEDVTATSTGRQDHIQGRWPVQLAAGTTLSLPIRLHAFLGSHQGKTVGDYYSSVVKVSLTCK
jgi:hypothetical protein